MCDISVTAAIVTCVDVTHFQGLQYPTVDISQDLLRPSISRVSARSAFIEHTETPHKRLLRAWFVAQKYAFLVVERDICWLST